MNNRYIVNIIIVILILVAVFLSQQPRFNNVGRSLYLKTLSFLGTIWQKIKNLFDNYILPRLLKEVEKRKENAEKELKTKLENKKESIKENLRAGFYDLTDRIKIFFKTIFYSIF